jgi:energy-coupling factor transporter ATP-binding protein EcfA2
MEFKIERFVIRGLHQTRNYEIKIRDNRIVMVGVNGLGKTTVVNLLYLILSRQWERVLEYTFESISLTINQVEYTLKPEQDRDTTDTSVARRLRIELARMIPREHFQSIPPDIFEYWASLAIRHGRDVLATELDRNTSIPSQVCRRFAASFNIEPKSFNKEMFSSLDDLLKQLTLDCQILYLPTYRRIEKDLSLIFPDLEESTNSFQRRKGMLSAETRRDFIELVEFGMEDVEATFRRVQSELVQKARSELNTLAGGYLRDVIRGEGHTYHIATFNELDNTTIDRILNRVDERTLLGDTDKSQLRTVIEKLQSADSSDIAANDQYIAHFFSKLISVDRALARREQQIVRFAEVCNKYLSGKEMAYSDTDSSIGVRLLSTGRPLPLRSLSSGEKQIVSLFSHLYLRELGKVYVIIDEPELSLSVTWQEQLLPDILETGNCNFLAAVTHSPFIFKNCLDTYAIDLGECITEVA